MKSNRNSKESKTERENKNDREKSALRPLPYSLTQQSIFREENAFVPFLLLLLGALYGECNSKETC